MHSPKLRHANQDCRMRVSTAERTGLEGDDNARIAALRKVLGPSLHGSDGRRFRQRGGHVGRVIRLLAYRIAGESDDLHFLDASAIVAGCSEENSGHHGLVRLSMSTARGCRRVLLNGVARVASVSFLCGFIGLAGHRATRGWGGLTPEDATRCLAAARHIPRGNHRHAHDRNTQSNCHETSRHSLPLRAIRYLVYRLVTFPRKSRRFFPRMIPRHKTLKVLLAGHTFLGGVVVTMRSILTRGFSCVHVRMGWRRTKGSRVGLQCTCKNCMNSANFAGQEPEKDRVYRTLRSLGEMLRRCQRSGCRSRCRTHRNKMRQMDLI
jgi:hypothetical protein